MRSVCILSCFRLCDPMDCSSPGSSVHGILQARILVWVVMPSSRDLLNWGIKPASPATPALQVDSLPIEPIGKPQKWGDIRSNHSLSRWQFIQYFLSLTLHLSKGFNNTCCVSRSCKLNTNLIKAKQASNALPMIAGVQPQQDPGGTLRMNGVG